MRNILKTGDIVKSIYNDKPGTIKKALYKPNEIQDYYIINWIDGTTTKTPREEIY